MQLPLPPLLPLLPPLLLLLLPAVDGGPPYAYSTSPRNAEQWVVTPIGPQDFKAALFGGSAEVINCGYVTAEPRLANASLTNAAAARGKVVLVHRDPENVKTGRTSFVQKALHAQAAGAVMVIVVNHKNDMLRPADVRKGHDGPVGLGRNVTVPVIAVPQRLGQQLLAQPRTLLSLHYDVADSPPVHHGAEPPVCVVQSPGAPIVAAQQHYRAGNAFDQAKKPAEALAAFSEAVALHPRHADAINAMGSVTQNLQKRALRAQRLFEKAVALEPNEPLFARNRKISRNVWRAQHSVSGADEAV